MRLSLSITNDGNGLAAGLPEPSGLAPTSCESLAVLSEGEITFIAEAGMRTRVVFPAAA
jgi:hypothetical protein